MHAPARSAVAVRSAWQLVQLRINFRSELFRRGGWHGITLQYALC